MRIFEVKPCGNVTFFHPFVVSDEFVISSDTVKVSVFLTKDEAEQISDSTQSFLFESDSAMLMRESATYNATTKTYEYALSLTDKNWQLGTYVIRWEATVSGNAVSEFDKLYVVTATREEIAQMLEMPSSISAGGVQISYSQRLNDMRTERGVRVGRITKQRWPSHRGNDSNRDYNR